MDDAEGLMCIPGLGDNRTKPSELGESKIVKYCSFVFVILSESMSWTTLHSEWPN